MANQSRNTSIGRRRVLAGIAAGAAAACLPAPAISQGLKKIKMTLPWLPQGSQLWAFVARRRGMWRARGLDVEVVRGFGSLAAIQTITVGRNEVGIIAAPTVIVSASQGLETRVVGVAGYDATMGLLTLDDGPVRTLKDLEGRKLGVSPGGAEIAFLDPFLERSGVDPKKVTKVALAPQVLESSVINRQVDAITAFATSNLPNLLARGIKPRFFPYASAGLTIYSNCLTTTPEYLKANRSVVEAWADGLLEAIKFSILNFEESVSDFLSEVPEMKTAATSEAIIRYGGGLFLSTLVRPEFRDNGLGWASLDSLNKQTDLIMQFVAGKDSKRPVIETIFSNDMAGKIKLTPPEWETLRRTSQPYAELLNLKA